jgi:hypothetical protein
MISQPEVKEEIKKIAERYGLSYKDTEGIIDVYFKQVADTMGTANRDENYFPVISVPYFGRFFVSIGRQNFFKRKNKEALNEQNECIKEKDTQE